MATVIDELVVILGLDPSKFTDGQRKVLETWTKTRSAALEGAKDTEAYGKQAAAAFSLVRNSVLRLAAAYVGVTALKNFARDTTESVAATGRLAHNIGATTHEVALWENAIKLLGGSGQAAGASMQGLQQSLQQFALTGESEIVPYLRSIGVALTDVNTGKLRDITSIYLDLADKFAKMPPAQANFIGSRLGLDQGTINLLERGRPAVEAYLQMAERAGAASDAQAKQLQNLQTSWVNFGNALTTVGRDLLTKAAPSIDHALDAITDALEKHRKEVENKAAGGGAGAAVGAVLGFLLGGPVGAGAGALIGGGIGAAGAGPGDNSVWNRELYGPQGSLIGPNGEYLGPAPATAPASSSLSLFDLIQKLEGSGAGAVSAKGAVGRNQILPSTAAQYGFDPARLDEPAYNDRVARAIEADLWRRYHGDVDAVAVAYNAGPGAADRFLASGRSTLSLPAETQAYLARERALTSGGSVVSNVTVQNLVVNSQAADAAGIARDIRSELNTILVAQANRGPQ